MINLSLVPPGTDPGDDLPTEPEPPAPPTPEALDIIRSSRYAEYNLDVFLNGLWVASAKNYAAADDVACSIWAATKARIVAHVMERIAGVTF